MTTIAPLTSSAAVKERRVHRRYFRRLASRLRRDITHLNELSCDTTHLVEALKRAEGWTMMYADQGGRT